MLFRESAPSQSLRPYQSDAVDGILAALHLRDAAYRAIL